MLTHQKVIIKLPKTIIFRQKNIDTPKSYNKVTKNDLDKKNVDTPKSYQKKVLQNFNFLYLKYVFEIEKLLELYYKLLELYYKLLELYYESNS